MMQTKHTAVQLELDFSDTHCLLDPLLVENLEKYDARLVEAANAAFQIFKKTPEQKLFGGLQLNILQHTIESITHHLWLISSRPNMNNVSSTISQKNWGIYLLARNTAEQINAFLHEFINIETGAYLAEIFEEKFFSLLQQKGIIENTKIMHGWIKYLLKLAEASRPSVNPQQTTDG